MRRSISFALWMAFTYSRMLLMLSKFDTVYCSIV